MPFKTSPDTSKLIQTFQTHSDINISQDITQIFSHLFQSIFRYFKISANTLRSLYLSKIKISPASDISRCLSLIPNHSNSFQITPDHWTRSLQIIATLLQIAADNSLDRFRSPVPYMPCCHAHHTIPDHLQITAVHRRSLSQLHIATSLQIMWSLQRIAAHFYQQSISLQLFTHPDHSRAFQLTSAHWAHDITQDHCSPLHIAADRSRSHLMFANHCKLIADRYRSHQIVFQILQITSDHSWLSCSTSTTMLSMCRYCSDLQLVTHMHDISFCVRV